MSIPSYNIPKHETCKLGSRDLHTSEIIGFLRYVIERDKLSIGDYLQGMGQESFFLVAATGLGKTVAVPIHNLIRVMERIGRSPNPQPRIWVVEPRIPIAVDQMKFMNLLWAEYNRRRKQTLPPLFGCITSASGHKERDSLIKFVTTGVFELMAKTGELTPQRDRVIIDEAHVTIEQNPGVELGIALARKAGVIIDYMSATVNTKTLAADLGVSKIIRADQQRYTIWKHNLQLPLEEMLPHLVEATLINPDLTSEYFPQSSEFSRAREVVRAVLEPGRSHGMLVVVNSFAGERSDIQRFTEILRRACPQLPVLQLASEVIRDPSRLKDFENRLARIEAEKRNYIILATSVVEMGITFPTLDYVATMDCGYNQETIGGRTFPVIGPLGVNSLLQRIGRVGRRRPGIAYISCEVEAPYALLEDALLNSGALEYEPIRFPLAAAPLMPLAYYAAKQALGGSTLAGWVTALELPSKLQENGDRLEYLQSQLDELEELGLSEGYSLTPLGERMEPWIGRAGLAYAVQLQRRFEQGAGLAEVLFWLVVTALSNNALVDFRARYDYFVDYDKTHAKIAHTLDIWAAMPHEDFSLFGMIYAPALLWPRLLFAENEASDDVSEIEFYRWCNTVGLESRKVLQAVRAVKDIWSIFCKHNAGRENFVRLFGQEKFPSLAFVPWKQFQKTFPVQSVAEQLRRMPGNSEVVFALDEQNRFVWSSTHPHSSGWMGQDDTSVRLRPGRYRARIEPSRQSVDAELSWRLTHLGS